MSNVNMKFKFKGTMRSNLIIFYSIIITISLSILGMIFYNVYNNHLKNEIKNTMKLIMKHNSDTLNVYVSEVIDSIASIALNKSTIDVLQDKEGIGYYNIKKLKKNFLNVGITNANIEDVIFISDKYTFNLDTQISVNYNSATIRKIINDVYASNKVNVKFVPVKEKDFLYSKGINNNLLVYFPIRDLKVKSEVLGVVILKYDFNRLTDICSIDDLWYDNFTYIMDKDDNYILSINNFNTDEKFESNNIPMNGINNNILYVSSKINSIEWKLGYAINLDEIDSKTSMIKYFSIILIIISILIIIIISTYIVYRSTKSIKILTESMKKIGKGNFNVRINNASEYEELTLLNNGFNDMAEKICLLINDVYNLKIKQKDAKIQALQAKINPHFLYNSFQLISSLAFLGRNKEIQITINKLGKLYEYVLYEKDGLVEVEKELTHIDNYLTIQNLRYSNAFEVKYNIDSNILSCTILKLSIQPIVENCINHGFNNSIKKKKLIYIKGFVEKNIIIFQVIDNGSGIDDEKLKQIKSGIDQTEIKRTNKHIGLINVNQRLKLKYGDNYGINIESKYGYWTKVTLFYNI